MTRLLMVLLVALLAASPVGAASLSVAESSAPITITQGGTYNGSWESTSASTPAIRVATTQPVTISGRVRNLAGGTLIDAVGAGAVQVTVDHVFAYGGGTYQTSGRFFQAYDFKSVAIRNSTIENTRGIELTGGISGSSVVITRNRHKNIQGGPNASPVGNFVQLRVVQNATIDVSWNEIVNEYNKSNPEDIISLYHTSNAKVHDNMLWHQSTPGNPRDQSSQGGITIDCSDAPTPPCNGNDVSRNQVVDGMGIVTYVTMGGRDNVLAGNRVIGDGKLPTGERIANGWLACRVLPGGSNNHAHANVIGYVNKNGKRMDANFAGTPEGNTVEWSNNTRLSGRISRATETGEWRRWARKLSARGVRVGA